MADKKPRLYNIPAGLPFPRILAESILKEINGDPLLLSRYCIFVPTRRSARALQEAFLDLAPDKTLLLPRIQPIGDLDEEELFFNIQGFQDTNEIFNIFPAISVLEREILLSQLVQQKNPDAPLDQTLALARSLGHFMDQIYNENLSLERLENLVPDKYAQHWQITIDFLKIISEFWPKILAEKKVIDYAQRRNQLILSLADFWQENPPDYPVIAAGSTGSLPATARLLSVVSRLPQGKVILPGYDEDLDSKSWDSMNETHPQFGFKLLFEKMEASREDIKTWHETDQDHIDARQFFAREIMLPAESTTSWESLPKTSAAQHKIRKACQNLHILDCQNENEEALCISLIVRQALENPETTIGIVTPDRNISQRLLATAKRWNITIDDTAGQTLDRTPTGQYFALLYQAFASGFEPVKLMAFLKHPLCNIGRKYNSANAIHTLDMALRGLKPPAGFKGLRHHVQNNTTLSAAHTDLALDLLGKIEEGFNPLTDIFKKPGVNFLAILQSHLHCAEFFSNLSERQSDITLWSGGEGKSASAFFAELLTINTLNKLQHNDIKDSYCDILLSFMQQKTVRPVFGTKPRVRILGLLEARMLDCDLVILSGLNEGIWPAEPEPDPWMSRPMRTAFGLPSRERSIGLSAHDFVQGLCMHNVVITRSQKTGGAPSVPARWLQRIETVLKAAELENIPLRNAHPAPGWARAMDQTSSIPRTQRPAPCPPLDKRPARLSVTRIETWLKDPYSIYARYILNLKKLDEMEKPLDAAEYGIILHKIIEKYTQQYPDTLPADALSELLDTARTELENREIAPEDISFWWAKLRRVASWLTKHEANWRTKAHLLKQEVKGEITFSENLKSPFTLFGYPDRIDKLENGNAVIIDYKSGGTYTLKAMRSGDLPQLPLEALMLAKGGFENLSPHTTDSLQYWVLNGQGTGGKVIEISELENLIEDIENKLSALIALYQNPETPYPSLPHLDKAPLYNDYEHLARLQEWAVSNDEFEGAEN